MRRLQLSARKKLRGIPRRMRSLARWAECFAGAYYPRAHDERFCHWKIPVLSSLVTPPQATHAMQAQCMRHMLRAAQLLAEAVPNADMGYYKVACLFVLPWLHQSEVTIFYDPAYYAGFFGTAHALAPRSLAKEFGLGLPPGFVERGAPVHLEGVEEEWWCLGQPL